jgi:hypothetical protein
LYLILGAGAALGLLLLMYVLIRDGNEPETVHSEVSDAEPETDPEEFELVEA